MADLEDDIESFPEVPYDFMRYLAAKISLMDLEKIPNPNRQGYFNYTEGGQRRISKFLDYAIEIYNQSHHVQLTNTIVFETIQNWWYEDAQNYNANEAEISK